MGSGARGPRALTPAAAPRRGSNFVTKSETSPIARGDGDRGAGDRGASARGAWCNPNFGRLVGTSGRVARAASVALCLGRRLCLGF